MTWVLGEIVAWLIGAFALGLGVGFLLWRWRRQAVRAESWNQLTTTAEHARSQLLTAETAHAELAREHRSLGARRDQLETELTTASEATLDADNRAGRIREELNATTAHAHHLRDELAAIQHEAALREAALGDAHARITELAEFEARSNKLQAELQNRDLRVADLEQLARTTETHTQQLAAKHAALQTSLSAASESLTAERSRSGVLSEQLGTLESHIAQITPAAQRVPDLESKLTLTSSERDQSAARVAELDSVLIARVTDLRETQIRLAAAQTRVAELEREVSDIAEVRAALGNARTRVTELDAVTQDLRAQTHAARFDLNTAHRRLAELELELVHTTDQLLKIDDADIASAEIELDEARSHIEKLEKELAVTDATLADLAASHRRIAQLEADVRTARATRLVAPPIPESAKSPPAHAHQVTETKPADDLTVVHGIGPTIAGQLVAAGISSWEALAAASTNELAAAVDVPAPIDPDAWIGQAGRFVRRFPESTQRPDRRTYRQLTPKSERI